MVNAMVSAGALTRRSVKRLIVMLALVGPLMLGLNCAPALASGTAAAVTSVSTIPATPQHVDAGLDACRVQVVRGDFTGYALCNTNILNVTYSDSTQETFVVGTDARLHHIWQSYPGDARWSGWQWVPGGGLAREGIWLQSESPFTLKVLGTDYNIYCNTRSNTNWTGWFRC